MDDALETSRIPPLELAVRGASRRTFVTGAITAGLLAAMGSDALRPLRAYAANPIAFGYPCDEQRISDNWDAHRARGSAGGTDYRAGYGSDVRAMADGVVSVAKTSNSDGTGRYIRIDHGPMGSYSMVQTISMHLSVLHVTVGQTVSRGQHIAQSGASGFGSDYGYGAHLHISGLFDGSNLDIEPYVGIDAAPPPVPIIIPRQHEEDHMYSIVDMAEGGIWIVGIKGKRERISSPAHVSILLRQKYGKLDANNRPLDKFEIDRLLNVEMDIVAGYMSRVNS